LVSHTECKTEDDEYLDLRRKKKRETVGNCMMRSFITCTLTQIQGDSKLLPGFPWPIIFKPEITK
jgi:hypothetical protein